MSAKNFNTAQAPKNMIIIHYYYMQYVYLGLIVKI